jgi:serine O-acetyltransferase
VSDALAENGSDPTKDLSFSELVFSDFRRHRVGGGEPTWFKVIPRLVTLTGMIATIILRAQQCLYRSGHVKSAWILRTVGIVLVGADFTPGMQIGTGLYMPHPVGIVIGRGLRIKNNVMIAQGVTAGARDTQSTFEDYPTICDGANIWAHAVIAGGVRVGEGAEVGANSVVTSDVADYTVVAGAPARKIADAKRAPSPDGADGASVKPG